MAMDGGDERFARILNRFEPVWTASDRSSDCSRVFSVLKTLISAPAINVCPGADEDEGVGA